MDLAGAIVLYDRAVRFGRGRLIFKWAATDVIVLLALIGITTATVFHSLKDTNNQKEKNQNIHIGSNG